MNTVTSKDGTKIAYDKLGDGPAVIFITGALCYRSFGPVADVAKVLASHFMVYNYDRRGRGDSGDTKPYAVEREIEDIRSNFHTHTRGVNMPHPAALLCAFVQSSPAPAQSISRSQWPASW